MTTPVRKRDPICRGPSRRRLLTAGLSGLSGLGSLGLVDLLRAEARAEGGHAAPRRSVIHIHLDGGPPQMDTIDMKPDGPTEVRGEFSAVATAVPGIRVCELLPGIARLADRFAFLRAVVGSAGQHDAFQCQSGYDPEHLKSQGGWPAVGSVLSKLQGRPGDTAPLFVDCQQGRGMVRNSARPGFLGSAHGPFRPDIGGLFQRPLEPGMQGELAARGADFATSLTLAPSLSIDRLGTRKTLLASLDGWKQRLAAADGLVAGDRFHEQAIGILSSGRVAAALDLETASPATLARYRMTTPELPPFETADGPRAVLKFLLARRMVEAGVRCVSISLSDFDTHAGNYPRLRQLLPILDAGLSGLIGDLEERGMLDDVLVVVWGEFGRTPKINKDGGRDHWPAVSPALLAGGGIRGGRVLGETDRWAAAPVGGAVSFKDVTATVWHALGIDPPTTTLTDVTGRPHPLIDRGRVLSELL